MSATGKDKKKHYLRKEKNRCQSNFAQNHTT